MIFYWSVHFIITIYKDGYGVIVQRKCATFFLALIFFSSPQYALAGWPYIFPPDRGWTNYDTMLNGGGFNFKLREGSLAEQCPSLFERLQTAGAYPPNVYQFHHYEAISNKRVECFNVSTYTGRVFKFGEIIYGSYCPYGSTALTSTQNNKW